MTLLHQSAGGMSCNISHNPDRSLFERQSGCRLFGLETSLTVCWPGGRGMAGRGSRLEVRQGRTAWASLVEGLMATPGNGGKLPH